MLKIQSLGETLNANYVRPEIAVVRAYCEALKSNPAARAYLESERNLKPETIEHFHLGYDSARDAISIPIFKEGKLVNIKYRLLNPANNKYTSESGAENWVFNESGFRVGIKHEKVLVVEGEFDLMSVWQSGIKNVVSPSLGKNSYGPWIADFDKIKEVYIAYDNDAPGRETAREMAERIGVDKSFEVKYPESIKDANDFFKEHSAEEYRGLIQLAKPYYSYQFKGMGDIIEGLRNKKDDSLHIPLLPKVEVEKDWLIVVSAKTNVGKTAYVLNVADWLSKQGTPVLVMPFERGIESVGKRFLQVKFDKTLNDFKETGEMEWDEMTRDCVNTPVYFAMPAKDEIAETIRTARRLFNTKVVIVDHLDYIVRNATNSEKDISNTLQEMKRVAEENGIIMIIVTHVRKIDDAGSLMKRKPGIEDLKGSSSLYQDPECVIMLSGDGDGEIHVDIVKNKGEMTNQDFAFNVQTGRMKESLFDSM